MESAQVPLRARIVLRNPVCQMIQIEMFPNTFFRGGKSGVVCSVMGCHHNEDVHTSYKPVN